MSQLLHIVAWAVVMTGTLVLLAACTWLSVVALRVVLTWAGWWPAFLAFYAQRRRAGRRAGVRR
ncbi:hypothetical protein [Corallococcus macrosporus]|uniref:Uncharacterized protein n=1 Tax=Myxococcus fulvus (strain ATCC BAA-855 / HW-1) TaxID=483219 RepID=F8C6K4_MYXFH|nr:hypothetical protein [Corallococcus macrosporus]AEI65593.1 hypothetical protein LILAB_18455 [Corallococcus macrosporus]